MRVDEAILRSKEVEVVTMGTSHCNGFGWLKCENGLGLHTDSGTMNPYK